ncbi:DUF6941 family protein [Gracilibacillus sp. HCP3S3_G5_1]|uniref:DUF6941 family protein n=1 Tax=unclassified Gracilibacillus TaxID=2625209 RepID=UPI003F8A89F0
MAQIGYVIICDEVFDNNNRGFTINNPYAQITPMVIPGQFSFSLSFSIFEIDPTKEYRIIIDLSSPHEKIWDADINFSTKPGVTNATHTLINIPFKNILLKEEGIYKVNVRILWDEEENSKELKFPVKQYKGDQNGR